MARLALVRDLQWLAASEQDRLLRRGEASIDAAVGPVQSWWDDHDLLVTPSTFEPAWPLGGSPGPRQLGTLAAPFSLTGQPALSLPLHHTDDGLPVGVQIVARRGADELLLRLAVELQRAADWTVRHPPGRGLTFWSTSPRTDVAHRLVHRSDSAPCAKQLTGNGWDLP
jgi:amidase